MSPIGRLPPEYPLSCRLNPLSEDMDMWLSTRTTMDAAGLPPSEFDRYIRNNIDTLDQSTTGEPDAWEVLIVARIHGRFSVLDAGLWIVGAMAAAMEVCVNEEKGSSPGTGSGEGTGGEIGLGAEAEGGGIDKLNRSSKALLIALVWFCITIPVGSASTATSMTTPTCTEPCWLMFRISTW